MKHLAGEVLGQHTCVSLEEHITMEENTLHLKVGFGKEGNQFFDFISPAMVYQVFGQLETEKKRGRIYFL